MPLKKRKSLKRRKVAKTRKDKIPSVPGSRVFRTAKRKTRKS